jgi:pimeloyl-ACP methyl ester carboxylesterase
MQHIEFQINGSRDKPITADVTCDETKSRQPVLIFVHGFKGFKDWGHFNLLASLLAAQGIVTVKFNFSYNGTDPANPVDITEPKTFGNNNLTTELNDLGLVIDCVYNEQLPIDKTLYDAKNITLMGHSRGGGTVILKTAEDKRVKKLVTLAALSEFGNFFGPDDYKGWKRAGVMHVTNYRTGQRLPMYAQYIDDFERNRDRLDIPKRAADITVPWFCIHGTADYVVDISHARRLKQLNPSLELIEVQGASHTFGGVHPFRGFDAHTDTGWIRRVIGWLKG